MCIKVCAKCVHSVLHESVCILNLNCTTFCVRGFCVYSQSLGQLGRVVMIDDSGGVVVRVNGRRWLLNSNCVLPAPGQQPEDEMSMRL